MKLILLFGVALTQSSLRVRGDFNIDDSILHNIKFEMVKDKGEPGNEGLSKSEGETVTMITRGKERYKCTLPSTVNEKLEDEGSYHGESPLEIIEKIFQQQTCAYRLESYWTYELCHGRFLRQFHEEKDTNNPSEVKIQEYNLGKFTQEHLDELKAAEEKDKKEGITRHPPTKKIDSMNVPYYEVNMVGGTNCDLNGQPRRTKVLYICYPAGKNEIFQLKETSTCEYEVVVLTYALCSHPHFKPQEVTEHAISCTPSDPSSGRKPADLLEFEADSMKLRAEKMWEAVMTGGDKPGQVRIEIKQVNQDIYNNGDQVEDEEEESVLGRKPRSGWTSEKRQPLQPMMDPQVVGDFLRGDYCLYGGAGWWKYEFCYGKKVNQYHEEPDGSRTVIHLGTFNELKHLKWLSANPSKVPKPVANRKSVSHMYSDGDVCDINGQPRHVEVKLKCKVSDSPSTVSLYLLEPRTCQYVLGVESPLVCDILPHADAISGLVPAEVLSNLGNKGKEMDTRQPPKDVQESVDLGDGDEQHTGEIQEDGTDGGDESADEDDLQWEDAASEAEDMDADLLDMDTDFDDSGYQDSLNQMRAFLQQQREALEEIEERNRMQSELKAELDMALEDKYGTPPTEAEETTEESTYHTTTTREQVKIEDGMKIVLREKVVDGVVVDSVTTVDQLTDEEQQEADNKRSSSSSSHTVKTSSRSSSTTQKQSERSERANEPGQDGHDEL